MIGIVGLVITGIIIADILLPSHTQGVKAAAGGIAQVLDPTYNALLGTPPGNPAPAKSS